MPTVRQKKLAQAIIKNATAQVPLTKKEMMVSSGYSEITADASPHVILEQKGVKKALNDFGFNEDAAKRVVAEILEDEDVQPKDRLKASELIFKVQGSFAPEKKIEAVINLNNQTISEEEKNIVAEYEEKLRLKMLNGDSTRAS